VEGPLYRAIVSGEGGRLEEWVLRYRGDKPLVVLPLLGPRGLLVSRSGSGRQAIALELSTDRLLLGPGQSSRELILTGQDQFGLRISEKLGFESGDFTMEVTLRLENRHSVPQGVELFLPWTTRKEWPKEQREEFQGQRPTRVVSLSGGQVHRVELDAVAESAVEGQWVGLESEWYLAAIVPRTPGLQLVTGKGENGTVEIGLKAVPPPLAPGQIWEGKALYYVGPKEYARLKAMGVGLEESIFFGGFPVPRRYGGLPMAWLGVPTLWLMNFFYRYIGNYGLAIILLTIILKILFYPLTLKSMASMNAMKALQPQVNALKAKYKNDAQRVQRETMELYRKQKVNPMGGCLPMVIQIPIFYALYVTLSVSVELQNAVLLCIGKAPKWVPGLGGAELWICDLAQYDPTYILPLLMGVSMFIQQKMTPTVGDPRQARIMLMMPIVFTFMFLTLPSGLVLYWFVSNVLQILQQYYLERKAKPGKSLQRETKGGQRP
jgi:YidC/Oxa1 family membrane protein insertase